MIETVVLEVCADCTITIGTGHGDAYRVDTLWRKFKGAVAVDVRNSVVSFRACEACGGPSRGVLFVAVHQFVSGEDSDD